MSAPAEVAERGAPRKGGGYQRPVGGRTNFELWSWFFMRISGLALIFLTLYHLIWWNLIVGVDHLDSEIVIQRWTNPFWRFYNVALVTFAILHALNGVRYSIEDYVRTPARQVATKAVVYTLVLGVWVLGVFSLMTFDPSLFLADR